MPKSKQHENKRIQEMQGALVKSNRIKNTNG